MIAGRGPRSELHARLLDDPGLGLALVDIDGFGVVNHRFDEATGDHVLRVVASRLVEFATELVPLGGGTFAVLSPLDATFAAAVAAVDATAEPITTPKGEIYLQASAGVATGPSRRDRMLDNAELALAASKASVGAIRVEVFDEDRHRLLSEDRRLVCDLRAAFARDELFLHYQPIVEIATRRVLGFEALVRWQHPELGVVSPERFVPLAESAGLARDLGRWVLATAATQAVEWELAAKGTYMSVNLSVLEVLDPGFPQEAADTLRRTGLAPTALVMEVTETAAAQHLDVLVPILEGLRATGIRVFMDDFGTGYSSLSVLRLLPLDVVKIDRTFVAEVTASAGGLAMAGAIIRLMRDLGLETVVEGTEDAAQLAQLRSLGCTRAQGYYFARPGSADANAAMALHSVLG